MNRTDFEIGLNRLICDTLHVEQFDKRTNILGIIAAYDILYIIDFIESQLNITAEKIFENLQYTDMSIEGLSNKIYGSMGEK